MPDHHKEYSSLSTNCSANYHTRFFVVDALSNLICFYNIDKLIVMLENWNSVEAGKWTQGPSSNWSRSAGLNELNFYRYALSSKNAPSDCLCRALVDARSTPETFSEENFLRAWTILRAMHPLLDSRFQHTKEGLKLAYTIQNREYRARQSFLWSTTEHDWEPLRNHIMNSPRIISDIVLSQLQVYRSSTSKALEIVLVSSHAISDGLSLVMVMNDLLRFLASPKSTKSIAATEKGLSTFVSSRLPYAMESQLPIRVRTPRQLWKEALAYVLLEVKQRAKNRLTLVGLPTKVGTLPITVQKVYEFSLHETILIKRSCKRRGFTMGHLIYAASSVAYTELIRPQPGSVVSIGSPINARRFFAQERRSCTDELVLALAFLDIILPCVSMETGDRSRNVSRLWTLAKLAKTEVHDTIQDPMFPYYAHIQQEKRMANAEVVQQELKSAATERPPVTLSFGSSAIGDLDKLLHTKVLPFEVKDVSLIMRARSGESLMHSYTIHGKLRLSLVFDENLGDSVMQQWVDRTSELMFLVINDDLQNKQSQL